MCGICGVWNYGDGRPIGRPDLERMRDTLAHRGPDDAGCYVDDRAGLGLGFRRLSIIDLSAAGHQPMSNEDGSIWTVFNGEIYNYVELRAELETAGHRFKSATDTETLLHGYEEWGLDFVGHLRGMFALALWDGVRRRLVLARDRVGIKPLYYHLGPGRLAFGSEIKAVLSSLDSVPRPNREAIYDYLTYNYIPAPKTAYQHVFKLPAGHYLVLENGQIRTHEYWDVSLEANERLSAADAVEGARTGLDDAVSSHLVADVPVGVFLSGGMDSSAIAVIMARLQSEPVETFSIGFDAKENELPYARLIADQIHSSHHEGMVSWPDVRRQLGQVVEVYDEPFADSSSVPTMAVSRLAREHVKVVLSGEGGDEAFAGYPGYSMGVRRARARGLTPGPVRSLAALMGQAWPFPRGRRIAMFMNDLAHPPLEQFARMMEWISLDEKRRIVPDALAAEMAGHDDRWSFRRHWRDDVDPLTRLQYLDLKTYLADDLLVKMDRASMSVSLEARVPMLDHLLLERLFSYPARMHASDGQVKPVLRAIMKGSLPDVTLRRRKVGFNVPLHRWLSPRDADWARTMIRSGSAVELGLLRPDAIDRLQLAPEWLWAAKVWVLLILETWARKYTGRMEAAA